MKVGDKFSVTIAGETIADAVVREVNEDDSTATLVVPATLVTMSYRTHDELTPGDPAPGVEGAEHILLTDQVVRPEAPGEQVNTVAESGQPAQTEGAPVPAPAPTPVTVGEDVTQVSPAVEAAVEQKATE